MPLIIKRRLLHQHDDQMGLAPCKRADSQYCILHRSLSWQMELGAIKTMVTVAGSLAHGEVHRKL